MIGQLEQFCAARGHALAELAIAWLLARPAVSSVIAGATRPDQIEANLRSIEWKLTREEISELDELTRSAIARGGDSR